MITFDEKVCDIFRSIVIVIRFITLTFLDSLYRIVGQKIYSYRVALTY